MPVAAIEKLKQKYPQYAGMEDEVLAVRLANKYPQYANLVDEVKKSRIAEEQDPFVRASQETQMKIDARQTPRQAYGQKLANRALEPLRDPVGSLTRRLNPATGAAEFLKDLTTVVPAAQATVESAIAEPGLAAQRGRPEEIIPGFKKAMRGESSAQVGDIARASGIPIMQSEPSASILGLLAMSAPVGNPLGRGANAAARGAVNTVGGAGNLVSAGSPKVAPRIAERIQGAFRKTLETAGDEFAAGFDAMVAKNPRRRVSIRPVVDELNVIRAESPKLASDLNTSIRRSGNKLLKDMLEDPELADDLSAVEAQEVKKSIDKVIKMKRSAGGSGFTDTDIDLIQARNKIKAEMLKSFPEVGDVFDEYAQKIRKFDLVKNKFKFGQTIGNVEQDFGDMQVMETVEKLLPKEALNDIRLLRNSLRLRGATKAALPWAAGGAAGLFLGRLTGLKK